jgi:predicted TIM-barrel fold metal-dependent hydrolase
LDTVWLPKDLWQKRLPSRFKDRAPRVVETANGSMWEWEGELQGESADGSSNSRLRERTFGFRGVLTPEGSLPPSDPKILLEHFDLAKMYAGVFFGNTRKWNVKDSALRKEMYRAFNDFVLELNSHAPDRIMVLPELPAMHLQESVSEMRRVVLLGARAVEFSPHDADPPLWDPAWEPLWAGAEDLDIPLCFHIGDRSGTPYPPNEFGRSRAHFSVVPLGAAPGISQVIFAGVFERHPKLHISFAECRVGWIPFLMSWMDRQVRERPDDPTAPLSMLPSEYFARNMSVTFEDDMIGARLVPEEWAYLRRSAMWGGDYPHPQGIWPDVDRTMEAMFPDANPEFKREIAFDRAARIFKVKGPSDSSPRPKQ